LGIDVVITAVLPKGGSSRGGRIRRQRGFDVPIVDINDCILESVEISRSRLRTAGVGLGPRILIGLSEIG